LNEILREAIPRLAQLYDEFTFSLDPLSDQSAESERQFNVEFANLCDLLKVPDKHAFRRHVILLCKKYLRRGDLPGQTDFSEPKH
jgi:hypothetical protein